MSIRQRGPKPAPTSKGSGPKSSPASRGSLFKEEDDMIQVNIDDNDAPEMTFNSYYRPTTPIMIPDKYYKDFMTGKPSGSAKVSMCPDGHTCAGRCIGFSWVAVIFLLWVGFMTDTQPIFIKGIQPKDEHAIEGVTYKVKTANQRLPVTKHADADTEDETKSLPRYTRYQEWWIAYVFSIAESTEFEAT